MGTLCQPVSKQTGEHLTSPASFRMRQLFDEFLGRYYEWKKAKLQEVIAIALLIIIGMFGLMTFRLIPSVRIGYSILMVVIFFIAIRHYIEMNNRVNHSYVNLHILHHHLIGKLEVGFCDHHEPCQCAENFRYYVLKNYNISLYNGIIK